MKKTVNIKIVDLDSIPKELLERRWPSHKWVSPELEKYVSSIIEDVKREGDKALIEFSSRFDAVQLSVEDLKATREEVHAAYKKVKKQWISALSLLKDRIEYFERQRLERMSFESEHSGVKIHFRAYPIRSVGCYVPGGQAAYASTLVMVATPAKLAGVRRVVACSPPSKSGSIDPLTLVAADLCGVDEVYKVGGAHAIAALAYGTESINPVEKIVGPGNVYVSMAKILVSRDVAIDGFYGPTEILILADESADPELIALDLVSQAEHSADSVPILVTASKHLGGRVVEEVNRFASSSPRRDITLKSLSENGLVITCRDLEDATDFVNKFAPEHVEIVSKEPATLAEKIESAGLILMGPHTPVSASDYALGTNHVLPTSGYARVFSGLSVSDFTKRVSIVECSKDGLSRVRSNVKALAEAEGLPNHALAVEGRFRLGREE